MIVSRRLAHTIAVEEEHLAHTVSEVFGNRIL
jgi:hypothetical protein